MRFLLRPLLLLLVAALEICPAHAQVPERGYFGALDGRWMWLGGDLGQTSVHTTSGPGGQILMGYKFASEWDIALAGDVQGLLTEVTSFRGGTLSTDSARQHIDLELGYNFGWGRVDGGLRGFRFMQRANYIVPGFTGYDQRNIDGIGPKIGAGARWQFGETDWAVVAGADFALVYGSFVDSGSGVLLNSGSYSLVLPQVDGELGLNWSSPSAPLFSMTAGARLFASFNTSIVVDSPYRATWLEFGPFARVAYNFGARPRKRKVETTEDQVEGSSTAPIGSAHVLYFDFDDTTLTGVARAKIRQASHDMLNGKTVSLKIVGLGDRPDSKRDQELAQDRVESITQELARLGVPNDRMRFATFTF